MPHLGRRAFSTLALAAWPAIAARPRPTGDRHAQFASDIARSYACQYVALDMQDVNDVFRSLRAPVLGVGMATGPDRAALACQAALRDTGGVASHAVVVIAFPPHAWRLREYTSVIRTVGAGLAPGTTVIYALCDDALLAPGSARVGVLTG